jgi:hypothetical protein
MGAHPVVIGRAGHARMAVAAGSLEQRSHRCGLGAVGRVAAAQEIHLCRDIVVGL